MSGSTFLAPQWSGASVGLILEEVPADLSVGDASYQDEWVILIQPESLGLLWPVRLRLERDNGAFIASDDVTGAYGEGDTQEAAVRAYRDSLSALHRVLSRQHDLDPALQRQLAVIRSLIPPGQ